MLPDRTWSRTPLSCRCGPIGEGGRILSEQRAGSSPASGATMEDRLTVGREPLELAALVRPQLLQPSTGRAGKVDRALLKSEGLRPVRVQVPSPGLRRCRLIELRPPSSKGLSVGLSPTSGATVQVVHGSRKPNGEARACKAWRCGFDPRSGVHTEGLAEGRRRQPFAKRPSAEMRLSGSIPLPSAIGALAGRNRQLP